MIAKENLASLSILDILKLPLSEKIQLLPQADQERIISMIDSKGQSDKKE